jgi:hypothetical protein
MKHLSGHGGRLGRSDVRICRSLGVVVAGAMTITLLVMRLQLAAAVT